MDFSCSPSMGVCTLKIPLAGMSNFELWNLPRGVYSAAGMGQAVIPSYCPRMLRRVCTTEGSAKVLVSPRESSSLRQYLEATHPCDVSSYSLHHSAHMSKRQDNNLGCQVL